MKRIYFMRHSYAGQTDKYMLNDHERPLTEKGEKLVKGISGYFNKNLKDSPPEIILCSTALRAKQTALTFKKNFKLDPEIQINAFAELYITGNDEVLSVIHGVSEDVNSILIISHNPGLLNFITKFASKGDKKKFRDMKSSFTPGSFAVFDVEVNDWYEVANNNGILLDFINAKQFK